MPHLRKVSDEDLLSAYKELKSVWAVGKRLGMCGQSAHERLTKLGVLERTKWTLEEDSILRELYSKYNETLFLKGLEKELNRSAAAISCRANEMGITNPLRKKSTFHNENIMEARFRNGTVNSFTKCSNPFSRSKIGKRLDLNNQFFRSSAEANYARYLNYFGYEWQYEPKEFYFDTIKKGCVAYTPDFYVKTIDKWIEVKGWFNPKSVTKIKRFKKYYPTEFSKLIIVSQSKKTFELALSLGVPCERYEEIKKKFSSLIVGWEITQRC